MKVNRFEDLECWKEARKLTQMVYEAAKKPAFYKDHRLVGQVTGSAISVMNNIAEGFDSGSDNEFLRYLGYSRNSDSEIQSSLYVALDQKYINQSEFDKVYKQAVSCRKLIDGLRRYLKKQWSNN